MLIKVFLILLSIMIFTSCTDKNNVKKSEIKSKRVKGISKKDSSIKLSKIKKKDISLYKYDISGFTYITYENQGLNDVNVKLINHKKLVVGEAKTHYSGMFKLKGKGSNISLENLSKWYISLEKTRYKSIKIPLVWVKKDNTFLSINKKLNINIKCAAHACMDICCTDKEVCSHSGIKGFAKCMRVKF